MFTLLPGSSKILPREYRAAAERLFPPGGFPIEKGPNLKAVGTFAEVLGIAEDYKKLWDVHSAGNSSGDYLDQFQNNLDLLIQKTWVEKAEEIRKENLLDKVEPFVALIERRDYLRALDEWGSILEELAYLLFGAQSQKEDFAEYIIRIDDRMGLFWWYGGQIKGAREAPWVRTADPALLYALLIVGISYLTDF